MKPVVIENPILNSPFDEPSRHFRFDDDGITDQVAEGRRRSSYVTPVAVPRQHGKQQMLDAAWVQQKNTANDDINHVRGRVKLWRDQGYSDITDTTRALLDHWRNPRRERRLFFCQIEAVETFIFLTESAAKGADAGILDKLTAALAAAGTALPRRACKMATGSGKTAVMAMLIAWHTLNKRRSPRDNRFTDAFLVVTPGITIRDRLRVLLPSDPANYYAALDLVPVEMRGDLGAARVVITNYHAFKQRERTDAGRLTKAVLARGGPSPFTETPPEVVRRVCRELGTGKQIVVLNDEAHHCYRSKPAQPDGETKLTGEEKREAQKRDEEARLWLTGLEWVAQKVGVKAVYDLSATPFYLKGSGYPEGTLFPWVVSDFSLIDAIEAGIVKVPRVPIADDALSGEMPVYRELWSRIRDALPRKGRGSGEGAARPALPSELEGALKSLYGHYERQFADWREDEQGQADGRTPPVFIVVCNNTSVSKMVFDWIAGHETNAAHLDGAPVCAAGNLPLFSNSDGGRRLHRPNTILVDSAQLDSGEGMSPEFKKIAAGLIDEFKSDLRQRFPGRDAEAVSDEELMREVMNTVGKAGKLGEQVRCVVSVSMLTEGWDANTVTHILGVRAFGTQLLCEQVIGRGLRRMSYALNDQGRFDPEYAEVYGVPFSFLPCAGTSTGERREGTPRPGRVRALPERLEGRPWLEIAFPRVVGYRHEIPAARLEATFSAESKLALSSGDVPTRTENAPVVGETVVHTLDALRARRVQEVDFALARRLVERFFPANDPAGGGGSQAWLFPQLLAIVKRWRAAGHVQFKDNAFPQLLLLGQNLDRAAEKIHRAIAAAHPGERAVRAILQDRDEFGSTAGVSFDTSKPRYTTAADRCHINFVPCDSDWERHVAQALEQMPEVLAYAKNQNLGFRIPYVHDGRPGSYYPDYLVKVDDGRGPADPLNLVIEVSGQALAEKEAKVSTARRLWVPAVNAEGRFGRWAFLEDTDPLDVQNHVRQFLGKLKQRTAAGQPPGVQTTPAPPSSPNSTEGPLTLEERERRALEVKRLQEAEEAWRRERFPQGTEPRPPSTPDEEILSRLD